MAEILVAVYRLARALAREVQIGQPIKAKWFKPVAEILAAVYRLRKGVAQRRHATHADPGDDHRTRP